MSASIVPMTAMAPIRASYIFYADAHMSYFFLQKLIRKQASHWFKNSFEDDVLLP